MNYQSKIQSLLETVPNKLKVRYALDTALDCKHLMSVEGLECLRVTELWLQGKATREEVKIARGAAGIDIGIGNNGATHAAYATTYAITYATTYVTTYAADSTYAAAAAYTAFWTAKALNIDIKIYYDKLVEFISNISETERIVYNIQY